MSSDRTVWTQILPVQHADPHTSIPTASAPRFQVAVVGAGPAGSALALVLASAGLSVLLLEQSAFGAARVGELLSPDAVHILTQMAPRLAQRLLGLALTVVSAWSGSELEESRDDRDEPWRSVDRLQLDRGLAEEAASRGALLLTSARLAPPRRETTGRWSLQVEQQADQQLQTRHFECEYLVDATGRASMLSRQLGAVRLRKSGQVAVVGFLELAEEHEMGCQMLLEAVENGWWYSAPISERDAVAVFVTDEDLDKGGPQEAWLSALSRTIYTQARLGHFRLKERPRRVAAGSSMLLPSFGPGWMAVGDAASCFDPLSIHGLGRALVHGAKVGEFLALGLSRKETVNPFRLAEESGEEFLRETMMLSRHYQRVGQWPASTFWRRRQGADPQLALGRQKRQPRSVPVSWGQGIAWTEYLQLETELLAAPDLELALRQLRWRLCLWACRPQPEAPNLSDVEPQEPSTPESFLSWLENLLLGSLLCCLEHEPGQDSRDLFRRLSDDQPVTLTRMSWSGRFSELARARQLQDLKWLCHEIEGYQRDLVLRKFLVLQTPLLHNLCLICVLPDFLRTYALLFSMRRGAARVEREDYEQSLRLAESEIVTCTRLRQLPHTVVGFHLDEALRVRQPGIMTGI